MPACSFGIWILFLHVNRSIRMKTDENSLYLGPFHRRKPPAETASLHACRAHDNHLPPLAAFVRRQCGGFRRAALRWAGAPGRRRSGALAPLRARYRAKPGSGRVGEAHPPPRRRRIWPPVVPAGRTPPPPQKRQEKARPHAQAGRRYRLGERGVQGLAFPGAKPGPMIYGPGRHSPSRRGQLSPDDLACCCANIAARAGPGYARIFFRWAKRGRPFSRVRSGSPWIRGRA